MSNKQLAGNAQGFKLKLSIVNCQLPIDSKLAMAH
jgi:hypothetical protein